MPDPNDPFSWQEVAFSALFAAIGFAVGSLLYFLFFPNGL